MHLQKPDDYVWKFILYDTMCFLCGVIKGSLKTTSYNGRVMGRLAFIGTKNTL